MSTLPHDSESDDIFGHLLDYQQTDEFREDLAEAKRQRSVQYKKANDASRQRHPEFIPLRREAQKRKPELFKAQNGLCYWCKEPLGERYDVDHIIPLSKGGTSALVNLCVCHGRCNRKKSARIIKPKQPRLF